MMAVSDIWHQGLLFRYWNKRCRTKSFHSDIEIYQYRIFQYLKLINHSQMTRVNSMRYNFLHWFQTHSLHVKYLASYHLGQKFIPISDIMSDSALFSPIWDVLISGSVRYRWSLLSDWVLTYVFQLILLPMGLLFSLPPDFMAFIWLSELYFLEFVAWEANYHEYGRWSYLCEGGLAILYIQRYSVSESSVNSPFWNGTSRILFKGIIQRDLTRVKSCINR